MGIPGAGKSRVAQTYGAHGHVRLNRDERGGTLRALADELEAALASGARQLVVDNTYATRASRSHVIEVAARHGARCDACGSIRRSRRRRSTWWSGSSSGSAPFRRPKH